MRINQRKQLGLRVMAAAAAAAVVGLGLLTITGCSKKDPSGTPDTREWDKDAFVPEGEIHAVDRFTETQSARGAKADAMLYPRHFDGPELNALGMSKVNLMLQKNPAGQAMVVYLNTGEKDEHADARQVAVEKYVASSEYTATALDIRTGPNLGANYPSQAGIASLPKTDTAQSSDRNGAAGGGMEIGSGGGTSGGSGGGGGGTGGR